MGCPVRPASSLACSGQTQLGWDKVESRGDPREGRLLQNEEGVEASFSRKWHGRMTRMLAWEEGWIPGAARAGVRRDAAACYREDLVSCA